MRDVEEEKSSVRAFPHFLPGYHFCVHPYRPSIHTSEDTSHNIRWATVTLNFVTAGMVVSWNKNVPHCRDAEKGWQKQLLPAQDYCVDTFSESCWYINCLILNIFSNIVYTVMWLLKFWSTSAGFWLGLFVCVCVNTQCLNHIITPL